MSAYVFQVTGNERLQVVTCRSKLEMFLNQRKLSMCRWDGNFSHWHIWWRNGAPVRDVPASGSPAQTNNSTFPEFDSRWHKADDGRCFSQLARMFKIPWNPEYFLRSCHNSKKRALSQQFMRSIIFNVNVFTVARWVVVETGGWPKR